MLPNSWDVNILNQHLQQVILLNDPQLIAEAENAVNVAREYARQIEFEASERLAQAITCTDAQRVLRLFNDNWCDRILVFHHGK